MRGWEWFAGVFEGEGSIVKISGRCTQLTVSMTDPDIVFAMAEIAGAGNVMEQWTRPGHKQLYRWSIAKKRDVQRILNHILPYLGERRKARARVALITYEVG